jgi:chemotaxis protein MotB
MKKQLNLLVIELVVIVMIIASCGPSKKLIQSEAKADKLQKENASTLNQLTSCNVQVKKLTEEKAMLQNSNEVVENDLKILSNMSKMTIADQARRLRNLQDIIQKQRDIMTRLQNSLSEALLNYSTDELSVYIKDGNVYVSLEEKLLFKSGSDVVDPKGKEALKSLALVLKGTNDITVMIQGHTDNIPIKTNRFTDNWDLSAARATSIVRILVLDNGFDPTRITAAGSGKFHPVKTNDTKEGRAGNRRTEVILTPDLKELFALLYQ